MPKTSPRPPGGPRGSAERVAGSHKVVLSTSHEYLIDEHSRVLNSSLNVRNGDSTGREGRKEGVKEWRGGVTAAILLTNETTLRARSCPTLTISGAE